MHSVARCTLWHHIYVYVRVRATPRRIFFPDVARKLICINSKSPAEVASAFNTLNLLFPGANSIQLANHIARAPRLYADLASSFFPLPLSFSLFFKMLQRRRSRNSDDRCIARYAPSLLCIDPHSNSRMQDMSELCGDIL